MKLAIIGTGKIVQEALPVLAASPGICLHSICARPHSQEKAEALAQNYGIAHVTTDYATVLADAAVEVVYVAVINSVHFPYAMKALKAGKSVILEKPACLNSDDLGDLMEEARRRNLFLLEAVTLLHLPAFQLLKDELLPRLGTIRHVECNYSQRSSRLDRYLHGDVAPAFDPEAGGGALMDINIYNLHFTQALLGPAHTAAYTYHAGYNGVDLSGTAVLGYPDTIAVCTGSKETDAPSFGLIQGDDGWVRIEGPVSTMGSITLCLRGEEPKEIPVEKPVHRLAPEFATFTRLFHQADRQAALDKARDLIQLSYNVMKTVEMLQRNRSLTA